MNTISIAENIHWLGVNDRETHVFESLIPIPEGVSYNSYIIIDEKIALIDTVKADFNDTYLDRIRAMIGSRKVDYLIINHVEPDHSGCIKSIMEAYPDVNIIGNKKTAQFLEGFYGITENVMHVKDLEVLELGSHTLNFLMTPMLHWPETMMTYESSKKVLFSGDAFGGFGALNGGVFDDQLNFQFYEDEMRRYYANIVGRYSDMVQKALTRLQNYEVKTIASTHGIVWRTNPEVVIDRYHRWSSHQGEEGVVIAYGSMYGNTKEIADCIARYISELGIKNIKVYDASRTHVSYIMNDIWKYKAFLIGSSTYNGGLFPPVESLIHKIENSKVKNRIFGVFGSYSWSGESIKILEEYGSKGQLQFVEPAIKNMFSLRSQEVIEGCKLLASNVVDAMQNK